MRLYRIGADDIHATMLEPATRELDARGNAIHATLLDPTARGT